MVDGAERVDLPPKLPEYSVLNPQRVKRMDPDQRSGQEAFSGMLNEEKKKSEEEQKQEQKEEKEKTACRLLDGIQDGVILSKEAEALLAGEPQAPLQNMPQMPEDNQKPEAPPENTDEKNENNSTKTGEGHINITA